MQFMSLNQQCAASIWWQLSFLSRAVSLSSPALDDFSLSLLLFQALKKAECPRCHVTGFVVQRDCWGTRLAGILPVKSAEGVISNRGAT